jgi:two-component system sensor histidine kinase KdpD
MTASIEGPGSAARERRPTPEEMLELAQREEERERRGRLKIFFGAAPGVGKTYAMLESAQAKKRAGVDVVIGWVETHGRPETEALARGLDRLAPRVVEYRGVKLEEFDLDAALARRPGLILVDELAHTNAAGSRHARRWQDVEELLAAGIHVEATLNVQHVESLNDVVERFSGIQVRETVPDALFDRADEIELVDLPPDELLERLRQGKVYVPVQAERAAAAFFRKGNLIALRELALRRAAERVDAQAAEWKKEHGIGEVWGTRERLLVVVDSAPSAIDVVRAAYRMAARLRAPWIVLLVETPDLLRMPSEGRERAEGALDLAERLGAETLVVRGESVPEEILAAARERSATRVVVGKPGGRGLGRLRGSLEVARLVRSSGEIDVLVTSGEHGEEPARRWLRRRRVPPASYAWALFVVLACTGVCWATRSILTLADQAMIYLLGVLIVASRYPRRPSLLAAVVSVAALDFFFVPPIFTMDVEDLRYATTFGVMLVVALTVSTFTVRLREQAEAARQRERRTASLFAMSSQFVIETGVGAIAATAVRHVTELLEVESFVLLADRKGNLVPCGGEVGTLSHSERELAVARWAFQNGRLAGHGTETLPSSEGLYIPLVGTGGHLGVFGIALGRRPEPPTPSQWQVLETFVAQTALALERALLVERHRSSEVAMETERARNELLSAVTHDVRTPLASIRGAAETLLDAATDLAPATRREMLETIREESARLSRLIGDLLELTRLESGSFEARKEPVPVDELFDSALARTEAELAGREVELDLPEDVLSVPVDPVLMEQVLVNLLENAARHAAPSAITARAAREGERVVLEVGDRGPGIPPGEEERLFERFYRTSDGVRGRGTGLGLTVCRAIVRAHGGRIAAANRPGGGAVFRIELPADGPATGNGAAGRVRG